MIADRWGVTDDEVALRYPCDDFVPAPSLEAWRGVTVHASPAAVWAWVVQIQLAPYSYDWIDNGGRRSPRRLLDLPPPAPGQHFTRTAGIPQGRLLAVEPQVHYTGRIMGAVVSYMLVPSSSHTRLLMKVVLGGPGWLAPAVSLGDLVMARRQLLNLRELAENGPSR